MLCHRVSPDCEPAAHYISYPRFMEEKQRLSDALNADIRPHNLVGEMLSSKANWIAVEGGTLMR